MSRPIPGGALPRGTQGEPAMAITTLPASADALLLENQRMKLGVPDNDRPAFLANVRKRAAKAPKDSFAGGQLPSLGARRVPLLERGRGAARNASTRADRNAPHQRLLEGLVEADEGRAAARARLVDS